MTKKIITISSEQIEKYKIQLRALSNSGKYKKAYDLSLKLMRQYPDILIFAYYEAVMTAEESRGISKSDLDRRYKLAAKKLKKLLLRIRAVDPKLRGGLRNEYYWFSRQPYKQYLLGVERVKNGEPRAAYSQGVGACEMARSYAEKGNKKLFLKWSKISELAWIDFFKVDSKWFNSYLFYATVLGFQGRTTEMHKALKQSSKISGIPLKDRMFTDIVKDVSEALIKLNI